MFVSAGRINSSWTSTMKMVSALFLKMCCLQEHQIYYHVTFIFWKMGGGVKF